MYGVSGTQLLKANPQRFPKEWMILVACIGSVVPGQSLRGYNCPAMVTSAILGIAFMAAIRFHRVSRRFRWGPGIPCPEATRFP